MRKVTDINQVQTFPIGNSTYIVSIFETNRRMRLWANPKVNDQRLIEDIELMKQGEEPKHHTPIELFTALNDLVPIEPPRRDEGTSNIGGKP